MRPLQAVKCLHLAQSQLHLPLVHLQPIHMQAHNRLTERNLHGKHHMVSHQLLCKLRLCKLHRKECSHRLKVRQEVHLRARPRLNQRHLHPKVLLGKHRHPRSLVQRQYREVPRLRQPSTQWETALTFQPRRSLFTRFCQVTWHVSKPKHQVRLQLK